MYSERFAIQHELTQMTSDKFNPFYDMPSAALFVQTIKLNQSLPLVTFIDLKASFMLL